MSASLFAGGKNFPPRISCSRLPVSYFRLLALLLLLAQVSMPEAVWAEKTVPDQAASCSRSFLVIKNDDATVLKIPILENQSFIIEYIHSVALTPVADHFKMNDGEIWLEKTVYRDFGAGLPHTLERGQKMILSKGRIVVDGYKISFKEFDVRIGRIARHRLMLLPPEESAESAPYLDLPLEFLGRPGAALTISVEK